MKVHQVTHLGIQIIRRAVQLSVVALVLGIVFLSLYAHYRAARAFDDPQFTAGWHGWVLSTIDDRVRDMENSEPFLDGFKGTLWSMRLGGLDLTDPLAAAEVTAASRSIHTPLFISALIPVLVTMLLGRVFCSWICPAGLVFDFTCQHEGETYYFCAVRCRDAFADDPHRFVGERCLVCMRAGNALVSIPIAQITMGLAVLNRAACYVDQGQPCDYCVTRCPVKSDAIVFNAEGLPAVQKSGCVGCGVCVYLCPADALSIAPSHESASQPDRQNGGKRKQEATWQTPP